MDSKDYSQRDIKDYGWFTNLFYYFMLYCIVIPLAKLQYTVSITGRENIDKNKQYLYAGNHTSFLDPPFLAHAVMRKIAFVAKKELFTDKNPWLRFTVKNAGGIAVDRENPKPSTFKSVLKIAKSDWEIGIFPEGGTFQTHVLDNVQKGFIMIAKKIKKDIVPVAIKGFDGYAGYALFKKHIDIHVCEPISYKLPADEILQKWISEICKYADYKSEMDCAS